MQPLTLLPTPAVNDILRGRSTPNGDGCLVWTGWTNGAATPYGKFSIGNEKVYAHRAAYELAYGPIPEGHEIDHLCQNSLCVNAEHLEAVTPEENRDRVTQRRTHCKRGHEFTEENTYWVRPGARACMACRKHHAAIQTQRRRGVPEDEIVLLPTPAVNDMGSAYTPETWDAWTARMKAEHGNGNGHGKSLAIEAQRLLPTPRASEPDVCSADFNPSLSQVVTQTPPIPAKASRNRTSYETPPWREYEPAIRRWEHVLGRPAPAPTEPGAKGQPRLSPKFVEWLMGLPAGHVTDPAIGISRNDQLKALGNGVVPQQCAAATRAFIRDTAKESAA